MIAAQPKQIRQRSVRIFMVLDKQNPHGLALRRRGRDGCHGLSARLFAGGKNQSEFGPCISAGALRGDCPLVSLDQRFADCEAETQTSKLRRSTPFESIENFR